MTQPHGELGPELRQLAQAILDRLDPAVRAAAAMAGEGLRGPGRCQQVWCPVCALAALFNGEQHPLLSLIAEHSVTLMAMARSMAETPPPPARAAGPQAAGHEADSPASDAGPGAPPGPPPSQDGRYHHIPIVVETADDTSA